MRRRTVLELTTAVLLTLAFSACGGSSAADGTVPATEPMPEIDAEGAGAVISDAMLVASRALYLAIAGPADVGSVASRDGRLRLEWSDDADFRTGAGTYEITLDEYRIPADDAFAAHYYGYALSGTIRLASSSGERTSIVFGLDARHEEPASYPARRVDVELSGMEDEADREAAGFVRVNGRDFAFGELAGSF